MIQFSYRISCVVAVPSKEILAHAFHYEADNFSINETFNRPTASKTVAENKTMHDLFEPLIQEYASSYGLQREDVQVTKYLASSGSPDIVVSFWDGAEHKLETTSDACTAIAYYHPDMNLGYGLELYEYISKLPNNTFALRVGEQVPEGDVNLAFVHTPRINSSENVSFIDTAYVNENVIPMEQIESLVVPDENGVLSYADIISDDQPIVKRPPYDRFPSNQVNITRRFLRNEASISSALYYKFELLYHYDSDPGEPGKVTRYRGNQIQITDENGNVLGDSIKSLIYVRAMEGNPKIYWAKIYLQLNTDEEQTYKVRYNHVDKVVSDEVLKSVNKAVELYDNTINVKDGKVYVEGGKLRVINGISAYQEVSSEQLAAADDTEEVYMIEEYPDKDGYKITVPQKSEYDPRVKKIFNYKLTASFQDDEGSTRRLTFGYVTDWVINPEALLAHEALDYSEAWKSIGMRTGAGFLSARSLINTVLPMDMPSLPADATFAIEDADGNILYTVTSSPDNGSVDTKVGPSGSEAPQAKSNLTTDDWSEAAQPNVRIKNNPISHQCTIIPEKQKTELSFNWEASGEGQISSTLSYHGQFRCFQDYSIALQNQTKVFDVFTGWDFIGTSATKNKWFYNNSSDVLKLVTNAVEVSGYWNREHVSKTDYKFSAVVSIQDSNDDDVIGFLFRVRDEHHYYMFTWERQQMWQATAPDGNGVGRILLSNRGVSAAQYYTAYQQTLPGVPDPNYDAVYDMTQYLNNTGFGNKKTRIFKASPSSLPPYSDLAAPNCQYKSDNSGNSFTDITNPTTASNQGWNANETVKITVICQGNQMKVYISRDISDAALGTLVAEAIDNDYASGGYGLCNISQAGCAWSKMTFQELNLHREYTDWVDVNLTSNGEVKMMDDKPEDILKGKVEDYIKATYGTLFAYQPYPSAAVQFEKNPADLNVRIKDGYPYAQTNNYTAGGTEITPWKTSEHAINIKGTGKAYLMADGSMSYTLSPATLSKAAIPADVENFSWNRIWITGGDTVSLSIGPSNEVNAQANVPPIVPVGTPITWPQTADMIYKHEDVKSLGALFAEEGIYSKLGIPSDVPKDQVLLRIERGDISGRNKEFRVNYRWRYTLGSMEKFEVDQAYAGVNRMRLKNVLKPGSSDLLDGLVVDLAAWTNFEELEAVPILAIKLDDNRKIEVEKPKVAMSEMETQNWYVRVKNGRVKRRLQLPYFEAAEKVPQIYMSYPELISYAPRSAELTTEIVMDYTIPEYTNQSFYKRPVMLVERETPIILNEKTIQTRFTPIVLSSDVGISYLEVEALRINNSRKLRVADVDAKKGIIYLHDKIRDQDEVIVQYAYEEDWYTYRGFERKNETTGKTDFFHLDLNPSPGHKFTMAMRGLRRWVPGDMVAGDYTVEEHVSNELLVRQMHIYLRPTSIWVRQGTELTLIEGTSRTTGIFHTDEDFWFDPEDYYYDPSMLRIGKFTVQPNSTAKKDMIILDTRSRGGGLDEALSKAIIKSVNQESLYNWDIGYFDGEAYQENGVFIIRLPRSILRSPNNPDGFHESEIQAAVAKYKAYGNLPIIEYVDPEEEDLNIIGNSEFKGAKHITEYNEKLSSGVYFIDETDLGNGEDSILSLFNDAEYAITLPGTKLTKTKYRVDVKARLDPSASERLCGEIQIFSTAGLVGSIMLPAVEQGDWMVYTAEVELPADANQVNILVNHTIDQSTGLMYVDYVKMTPVLDTDEDLEVIEI
ncbi:hypothetical protein SAMN02799624_05418 [Paenibacillus sp. UNC496MF]|uniref:hypothetical protein n=1 Tax=Paenibacillus sp. UNC496MF TaxID=1502753 RepID=UPI0008F14E73|nr:hypothetical protein [Paenibacillus sp. UNC496MF]SFJ65809.1 hypothetical protein SAMN02799624_05418 [Paenibacillus sp. UNC496MF]